MALYNIFDIAGSAMSAQSVRLNTIASNMANAESISSSVDETYRARTPVFSVAMDNAFSSVNASPVQQAGAGVKVLGIVESDAPLRREYRPGHPLADDEGYINLPNVNVIDEMANMISTSRSYQTNVEVLNTAKQLMLSTLDIGQ